MLALPSDSPRPLLGRKNSLDDLYSTYNPPSVSGLLTRQFATVIGGAADFLLHSLYCANHQTTFRPDRQWGSRQGLGIADKALRVAFKFCTARLFGKRFARSWPCAGPTFPFLIDAEYEKDLQQSSWWYNTYPTSINLSAHLWHDPKFTLVCFTI